MGKIKTVMVVVCMGVLAAGSGFGEARRYGAGN